jgi:hypothetical protein
MGTSDRVDLDHELLGRSPSAAPRRQPPGWSLRTLVAVATFAAVVLASVPMIGLGAPAPAGATIPGSVVALPAGFTPRAINNQGWVLGTSAGSYSIWKPDGTLTTVIGTSGKSFLDFNDDGELLVTASGTLEIWGPNGSIVLAKPEIGGQQKSMFQAWGPDVNGRTVGIFGWTASVEANAASYLGAGAPQVITQLATVMRAAPDGVLLGMLPGNVARYAFLDGNQLTTAAGFSTSTFVRDMAANGYLLVYNGGSPQLLRNGASESLGAITNPVRTNDQGAVVGFGSGVDGPDTSSFPVLFRAPTGQVRQLLEITGDATFTTFSDVTDINDQCQVVGTGRTQGTPSVTRAFVADVPNCAGEIFDAELEVSDGGAVVNREFELTLTLSSEAANPVEDLVLGFEGKGISGAADELEIVSGPTPVPPETLGANASTSVTYRVIAKKPGTVTVQAAATGTREGTPISAETALDLDVATAGIGGSFFRTDNKAPFVKVGEPAPVRLRLANETGEDLTSVRLVDVRVVPNELSDGDGELERDGPGVRGTLAAIGTQSQDFVDYELRGLARGSVLLQADVTAKDEAGETVEATIESRFEVREDRLKIELELDPEEYTFPDDTPPGEDPPPLPVTSTLRFTNTGEIPLENIRLQDLDVVRSFSGQELYVTYKDGVRPDPLDPAILVEELAPGETSDPFITNWEATDDGEVIFKAFATSVDSEGEEANAVLEKPWEAKPTKYLEVTTEVVNPPADELLEAGTGIIVNGTVENLSNTASLEVGPLYPFLEGNTGTMTLAYGDDPQAPNPRFPVPVPELELEPGAKTNFQVRITTNYSDPRLTGTQASGGTRAILRWEPWAVATELDGDEVIIRTYDEAKPGQEPDGQVKATPADLRRVVSIDDSIALPPSNPTATATAFLAGTAQGLYNAAIAAVYAIPDLVKMPYSILRAAYEYQAKVWESFTAEEKDLFLTETSFLIVSVLQRNVELGLKDADELYDQVYEYAGTMLTETQNEWQTGDFTSTSQKYGAFLSETIGSVAGPIVLTKMAQTPRAAAAIERAQIAIQTRMTGTLAAARAIDNIDGALPLLRALESGAQLQIDEIAQLYGLTADEVALFQQIANDYGFLLTIRSRHASSIQWIQKFGALLKPEALKIKSVSEMDVLLGYRADDLGSLIFRKPDILKTLPDGADVDAEILRFVQSKGFSPGSKEHTEAVERVKLRIKEWNKHELEYKRYDEQGWIKTPFDYEGNAISDQRTGAQRGKFTGFRLRETSPGADEYVVQLLDGKTGRYKRVTGDIDPIAFTYTDGLPLSEADHRKLIQRLMASPVGAEHGESATFTRGGVQFISSQFKPDEPGLQFAPDAIAPRVVRLDPARSRWEDPFDYHLHWEGGFIDSGTTPERAVPGPVDPNFGRILPEPAPAGEAAALPSDAGQATVGRCRIDISPGTPGEAGAGRGTTAAYLAADGYVTAVDAEGNEGRSEIHATCFSEGDPTSVTVAPTNALAEPATRARPVEASLRALEHGAGARSVAAGSTVLQLVDDPAYAGAGTDGFNPGQDLLVGAGTDRAEIVTVARAEGAQIVLAEPLARSHEPGEVVVMVKAADGSVVEPVPPPPPPPPPGSGGEGPGSGGSGPTVDDGTLARTGSDPLSLAFAGLLVLAAGVAVLASRPRPRPRRRPIPSQHGA